MGAALLLGGCAVGGGGEEDEFGGLPEDKAVVAQPLTVDAGGGTATSTTAVPGQAGGPTTTGRGGTTATTSSRAGGGGAGAGGATTTTAPGAKPYTTRAAVADRTGDTEGTSVQAPPAYGDLVRLRLEDNGTQARVTVEMAADIPPRLREEEQVAVGVDLFRDSTSESDYQLYARGSDEGWLAWLDTPSDDIVEYPGTFQLGANRLVFTVPWSSLGGRRAGSLRVFAEREFAGVAVVADERKDNAPDRGTQSFSF